MQTRDNYLWSFGWSVVAVSLLSTLLVIVKQLHAPTKAWMVGVTGHHWITHGLIVVVLFAIIGLALGQIGAAKASGRFNRIAPGILLSTIASGLILVGFFFLE